jgi:isoamylase
VYGAPIEGDMITTGTPLVTPPLIDMISNDPILGGVKVPVLFNTCYLHTFNF